MHALRDYQIKALDDVRAAIRGGARRVCLQLPCGGGKTIISAEIIRGAVAKGKRSLFLAHRREILDQTVRKLELAGVASAQIGVHCADHPRRRDAAPVQAASVQTLVRRELAPVAVVIVDETHHSTAESYRKVLTPHQSAGAVTIGLTA